MAAWRVIGKLAHARPEKEARQGYRSADEPHQQLRSSSRQLWALRMRSLDALSPALYRRSYRLEAHSWRWERSHQALDGLRRLCPFVALFLMPSVVRAALRLNLALIAV